MVAVQREGRGGGGGSSQDHKTYKRAFRVAQPAHQPAAVCCRQEVLTDEHMELLVALVPAISEWEYAVADGSGQIIGSTSGPFACIKACVLCCVLCVYALGVTTMHLAHRLTN